MTLIDSDAALAGGDSMFSNCLLLLYFFQKVESE